MRLKTYVINLLESSDRREYILNETAKYPFMDVSLIEAVNGGKLAEEETERLFDRKGFVLHYWYHAVPGEIGCTLSHRKCYEALLSSEEEVALILEDDVSFVHPEDVELVIDSGVQFLKNEKADIILFVPRVCYYTKPKTVWGEYGAFPIYTAYETCAYLINRRGAERLLRISRPFMVADDFKYMLKLGLKILCVVPFISIGLSTAVDTDIPGRDFSLVEQPFFIRAWRVWGWRIRKLYFLLAIKKGWIVDRAIYNDL